MPNFEHPAVGISSVGKTHLQSLAQQAARFFHPQMTFCQQMLADLSIAIVFLELKETRLGVCQRSWNACALLSKTANDRAAYFAAKAGVRRPRTPAGLRMPAWPGRST